MLVLQLLSFQTCQSTQTHIYDSLCLYIGQFESLHQSFFCYLGILAAADNGNHFVNEVQSL